jgi:hypothetical protein
LGGSGSVGDFISSYLADYGSGMNLLYEYLKGAGHDNK